MALGARTTKNKEAVETVAPVPTSRLEQARAAVEAANGPVDAAQAELSALLERIRRGQSELDALNRGVGPDGQALDASASVERRLTLQRELDDAKAMVRPLEQRSQQAVERRRRLEEEVQHVARSADILRDRIDAQQGRIQRQQRLVEEAEGVLAGHRHTLTRLENQLAELQTQLVQTASDSD